MQAGIPAPHFGPRSRLVLFLMLFTLLFHVSIVHAGLGANLISNPSLETGTTSPSSWLAVKGGTATAQFTYPVAAIDGAKAAQVTVTSYVSGDEYWQPPTTAVTGGKQYQFTGYSKSTIAVPIIATYVKSTGGQGYARLGTALGDNNWQKFSAAVTMPADVIGVRIQHVLQGLGTMAIDGYSLQEITADNSAPTCVISASPQSITTGSSSTLTFSSTNTSSGSIDQGIGIVGTSGTKTITPSSTTLYTATFTGVSGATATCSTTVTVTASSSAPVISSFTATPTSITQGQSSTLAWSVSGAASLAINGSTVTGTSQLVTPATTTNYVLTATNSVGSVTASQSVTVAASAPLPTCSLTANPISIASGGSSTLTLTSANATSATSNFGMVVPNGSQSVSPTSSTLYTATVTGSGGTASCNVNVTVTAQPAGSNLIQNGDFEAADSGSTSSPLNWSASVWDATATFSYPVTGNGGKAAKITTTRVDTAAYGGATWSSPQVPASSHTIYQYSNDYMSDVTTNVSVEYLHQDGSYTYEWLNSPLATGTSAWAHQVINVTVPTDVVSFSVLHGLNRIGSLTIDNVNLVAMPASPFVSGMVSLVYDDGLLSQYNNAVPMLMQAGLPATFAIITTYPGAQKAAYMNWTQVQSLKSSGFEIASHTRTHPSLTGLTSTQAQQEIQGAVNDLAAQGIAATTLVYPYGDESPAIEQMANASGSIGARGSYFGLNAPFGNRYAAYGIRIDSTTTFAKVKQFIDQAVADKRWIVFELHDVINGGGYYAITPALMQSIIDYIKSSGVKAVTLEQGMKLMNQ